MPSWSKITAAWLIPPAAAFALLIGAPTDGARADGEAAAGGEASAEEGPKDGTVKKAGPKDGTVEKTGPKDPPAEDAAAEDPAADEAPADEASDVAADEDEVDWEEKPYELVDGKVDFGTYNGFRRYHSSCHVCHGPDGLGSTYAPPLIESITRIGYDGYLEAVVNGIENVTTSEQSVMPSFGEDPNVMNHVDDIYAYLKARADDAIGRGRPERLPKEKDE